MASKTSELADVSRKLDVMIALLAGLCACQGNDAPVVDRVMVLNDLGLTPAEIGKILGKGSNYVSVVLSRTHKKAKKGGIGSNGRSTKGD